MHFAEKVYFIAFLFVDWTISKRNNQEVNAGIKMTTGKQITFCAALREKYRPEALDDEFENIVIAPMRRGKCFLKYF